MMDVIYRLTISEGIHRRIFLLLLLMTGGFLLFYGYGLHLVYRERGEMLHPGINTGIIHEMSFFFTIGLFFASFLTGILAILSSVGSIQGEIENGLMYGILSKPISRLEVLFGKFLGNATLFYLYGLALFFSIIGLNHWLSGSTLLSFETPYLIASALTFTLQPIILLAVTMALSTRLSPMGSGVVMMILYGLSLIGGFIEQIGIELENLDVERLGILSSLILPVDAMYRMTVSTLSNHLTVPIAIPPAPLFGSQHPPSLAMAVYACLYVLVFLTISAISFRKRDI